MNSEVCFAAHDHCLDLAHEKPFAADVGEGAILDSIAFGFNVDLLDDEPWEVAA
jgi:hypothetical protein